MVKEIVKKSPMYDKLMERYLKGYVTDSQLDRYITLGQLTEQEGKEFRFEKECQDSGDRPTILPE